MWIVFASAATLLLAAYAAILIGRDLSVLPLIIGTVLGAMIGLVVMHAVRNEPLVRVEVEISHEILPSHAREVLLGALRDVDGVRHDRPWSCDLARLNAGSVVYEVTFAVRDDAPPDIRSRALTRMWHAMQRDGHLFGKRTESGHPEVALAALDATPLFVQLPEDMKEEMASGAEIELWDAGERVVEQGSSGDSCFIVRRGRLGVHVSNGQKDVHVATLQQGDLFGEMSLLTGEPRWATVQVEEDAELVRFHATALKTALHRSPELVQLLAETVASRRDQLLEARELLEQHPSSTLPDSIRTFMKLS